MNDKAAKQRRVQVWIDRAQYDLDTAKAMLDTGRYIYVVFMCQQAIEKRLKAYIEDTGTTPPRIHNLINLCKTIDVYESLPDNLKDFLQELTAYYLDSRYKEDIARLSAFMNKEKAGYYFEKTKEVLEWLTQKKKLSV
ncbi:MAG: HEPN domain-containing protein [bacterium]